MSKNSIDQLFDEAADRIRAKRDQAIEKVRSELEKAKQIVRP